MKIKVIASSREIFASDQAQEVYVPATQGITGILPGHAKFISTLEIGELRIKLPQETKRIALNGGLIHVAKDEILILADEASLAEELVSEQISSAIANAEAKISGKLAPSELILLEKILRYERFKQGMINDTKNI